MKRIIKLPLSLILIIALSSCQMAESKNTVERMPLSTEEQQIADLTSDIVEKFIFEKDRIYDINIYFYRDGSMEDHGGVLGIDTKGKHETVLISGRKDGNVSFAWSISGAAKYKAIEINDDNLYMMVSGVGQEKFTMEEGKEYALVFVAYKEGTEMPVSLTEPFYKWDTIEDKAGALSEFNYAYIITVSLSDLQGYK